MTPQQVELARHALGLDGRIRQSYRNRFFAGADHSDHPAWMAMCAEGFATVTRSMLSDDDFFMLTRVGAKAALKKGERLCPEDFPDSEATS